MEIPRSPEKTAVEDYIINELVKKGWHFLDAKELQRDSLEEPLLTGNLTNAIMRINKGLDEEGIRKVINELKLKGAGIEGVKQILYFLKNGVNIKIEKE